MAAVPGYTGSGWKYPGGVYSLAAAARANRPPVITKGKGGGGGVKVAKTATEMVMSLIRSQMASRETPAQQEARIRRGIDYEINARKAANAESTRAQQAQLLNQQNRAMGFANAIGSLGEQIGARTQTDYERAAKNIQGLGTGLTGAVYDAQQAAANKVADEMAQASGGVNTAGTSYNLEGLRNTAQYLGTTAPAADLYAEAANQSAGSQLRNLASAAGIKNLALDFGQKSITAQNDLAAENRKLQAERPDLYAKAVEQARASGRQDIATLASTLALANTQDVSQANIANQKLQTQIDTYLAKIKGQATTIANNAAILKGKNDTIKAISTANKNGVTAQAVINKSTGYDQTTGKLLPGYWLPAGPGTVPQPYDTGKFKLAPGSNSTKIVPLPGTVKSGTKKTGGLTASGIQTTISRIQKAQSSQMKTAPYAQLMNGPEVKYGGVAPIYKPSKTYAQAFALALQGYPAVLKKNKAAMVQIKAAIDTSLQAVGYTVP